MVRKLLFLLCLTTCLLCQPLWAHKAHFMLTEKSLSSCMINNLHQDRDGIMWISTENGLNRYDGTRVIAYSHHREDSLSLGHNYVRYFFEDRLGNRYVGHYLGVQLYRPDTDDFSPMASFADGSNMPSSPAFITETSDGQVIVSGNTVCSVTKLSDGSLRYDSLRWDIGNQMPGEVAWGRDGNLWFYIAKDAIYCVHRSGVLERRHDLLPGCDVLSLLRDGEGNLFIQTVDKDLYAYDFETGNCSLINQERISAATIKCVFRLDNSHLLLGTDGNGVKLLDEATGKVKDWNIDIAGLTSASLKVHHILRDREGDLWMSIYLKGVIRVPMTPSSFQYYGPLSSANNLVGSNSISALMASRTGKIYVGTDGEGAYCLDPMAGTSTHFVPQTHGGTMPTIVNTMFEDSEGTIWVGSYDEGCGRIDARKQQYVSCRHLFSRNGFFALRILGFAEDLSQRVWIASLGSGIFCYDLKQKRVIDELSFEENVNKWATCMLVTDENQLLIGSYDGVFVIDLNSDSPQPRQLFDRSIVYALHQDLNHRFWAGCSTGLVEFDLEHGRLQTFAMEEGLAGSAAYTVEGDDEGALWIGTEQGLSRFDIERQTFITYTDADGLQGRNFSKNASCRDLQGRIWMGGSNGVNSFQPALVSRKQIQLQARVTGFYLSQGKVNANTLSGGKPVCEGAAYSAKQFELAIEDNSFSIELSTLQFIDDQQVHYQYLLNDGEWVSLLNGSHLVNFSNLPAGTYRFRYRALANQQISPTEELTIVIRPAWWNTGTSRLIFVLLLVGLLWLLTALYRAKRARRLADIQMLANAEAVGREATSDPQQEQPDTLDELSRMQDELLTVPKVKSFNDKLMERLFTVVNAHISDSSFQIEQLCSEVGISRVHLYRKLKEIANQTPADFIRNCRLRQAERLLLEGNLSVQEVAEAVGFSKASNFSNAFKELYGYPPLKWKKIQLEQQSADPNKMTTETRE